MKILILGDGNSPHIIKWINGILRCNRFELMLCSLTDFDISNYIATPNFHYVMLGVSKEIVRRNVVSLKKMQYLLKINQIIKLAKKFNPSLIHAHYASSYGLLASFIPGYKKIVSVWGSDIYDFPKKSIIHKYLIKYVLWRANEILSTSKIMASEISKYTSASVTVVPFGIDIERFNSIKKNKQNNKEIVIGTIKTLEPKYGIDVLIKAFSILKFDKVKASLLIIGDGYQKKELVSLVKKLNLQNSVKFIGHIPYNKIHEWHNKIDIYVALSKLNSESFGVAILEASATRRPVVVSDVDGFKEVVINNKTGIIVPKNSPVEAAKAIEQLINDENLRFTLGDNGRKHVIENYNFTNNLKQMIEIYRKYE